MEINMHSVDKKV